MPIAVKDFEWEQSEDSIFIMVPLKGVASHKVDIISTEKYIKVNYPPFLFECFLYDKVFDEAGSVEVGDNATLFKIKKQDCIHWPSLQNQEADGNKILQKQLREEALERYQMRSEERRKEKSEVKHELGKQAVKQQMKLEDSDRKRIEDIKESERKKASEELENWKKEQKSASGKDANQNCSGVENAASQLSTTKQVAPSKPKASKEIFEKAAAGAPVRRKCTINVTFTGREFPTPKRESMAHEEDEWLAKQAEARRMIDLEDSDLTEEERNPMWLLNKGNTFYKAGNHQAAVNVYTHAIRLNCKMPAVYSNRAACHLHLNNLFKCIEDSSKAIELLTPPVDQNRLARIKAHVRRGTAFCKLELYVEGLMDYEAALKLDPTNEGIKNDANKIRDLVQSSTSSSSSVNMASLSKSLSSAETAATQAAVSESQAAVSDPTAAVSTAEQAVSAAATAMSLAADKSVMDSAAACAENLSSICNTKTVINVA